MTQVELILYLVLGMQFIVLLYVFVGINKLLSGKLSDIIRRHDVATKRWEYAGSSFEDLRNNVGGKIEEVRAEQLEQFKHLVDRLAEIEGSVVTPESFEKRILLIASEQGKTHKILMSHLEQVKQVIAAAMPYMQNKDLTPENVAAAFKQLQEDNEMSLQEQTDYLNNMVGGDNF